MIELQSSSSFTIQPHNPEFCTTDFEVVIEKEKIIKKEVIVHFLNNIQCPYLQILLPTTVRPLSNFRPSFIYSINFILVIYFYVQFSNAAAPFTRAGH